MVCAKFNYFDLVFRELAREYGKIVILYSERQVVDLRLFMILAPPEKAEPQRLANAHESGIDVKAGRLAFGNGACCGNARPPLGIAPHVNLCAEEHSVKAFGEFQIVTGNLDVVKGGCP